MRSIWVRRIVSIVLTVMVIAGIFCPLQSVQASQKTLSISQVRKMALAGNDSYRRKKSQIALKEVSYEQAVKSLSLKETNENSYRWSPMLTFHLPEGMDFEEESSLVCKPLQLQTEIKLLKNSLHDEMYGIWEETEQIYLKVYMYQEKVKIEEESLEELKKNLKKNKGRLVLGLSDKTETEEIENKISETEEKLAQDKKNFINEKEKLGELINLDVSTQYIFENPSMEIEIPRNAIEEILTYALEHDKTYFEAKMKAQLLLLQFRENYALLEKQYGTDAAMLQIYAEQIQNGKETDYDAFKASYDKFLEKIEETWEGDWKILSLSIPKEWIMKEDSGIRYIEDKPYALYENALEYQQALAEAENVEKELENQIRERFENLITAANKYNKLQAQSEKSENKLKKEKILNSMGELSFEEYVSSQRQHEELQVKQLEALEGYSSLLFQFERITCGAVSEYVKEAESLSAITDSSNKYLVETEEIEGAKYYMQSIVEDNMFEFGILLPKDLKTEITHYELRVDDYVIGQKTEIGKTVRHLTMLLTGEEKVFVRFYKGKDFVDDCEIDAFISQGTLKIKNYVIKEAATTEKTVKTKVIGNYEIVNKSKMGLMEILLNINVAEDVSYYSIQNKDGKSLISEEQKNVITDSFTYLELSPEEMKTLKIQCYDEQKVLKYTAYFDTKRYEIYKIEEKREE